MTQLEVPEVNTAVGERSADRRHLSRAVFKRHTDRAETVAQGSTQMPGIGEGLGQLLFGIQHRRETCAEPLNGVGNFVSIGSEDVEPHLRIRRRNACEIPEAAGGKIHRLGNLVGSFEQCGRENLRNMADASDGSIVFVSCHPHGPGPEIRDHTLNKPDIRFVRAVRNDDPCCSPEQSGTSRIRSRDFASCHWVSPDEAWSPGGGNDRSLDGSHVDYQSLGLQRGHSGEDR